MTDQTVASSPSPQQSAPSAPPSQPQGQPPAESNGASPTLLGGGQGNGTPPPAAAQPPAPSDQQDWRARFAGDDAKALEALRRYKTEADFGKAFLEQRTALSKRAEAPKLAEKDRKSVV